MSWQDDLRKLDDELATGRLSADEYRVRRDQVLASATGAQTSGSPQAENTQFITPVGNQEQQPHQPDRTQVVPSDSGQERTQAVSGWQSARPTGDADRTQIVSGSNMAPPPGGMPPGGMPPGGMPPGGFPPPPPPGYQQWAQQGDDMAPPWAGSEFPPLTATGNPDWIRQGPEVFDDGGSGTGKKIALIAVIVVVLAGLGVGGYLFLSKDGEPTGQTPPAGTTTTQAAPTTTPRPKDDLEVAELPGALEQTAHIKTFADAEQSGFLTSEEIAIYKTAKAGDCRLTVSLLPGEVHAYIFTTKATSPSAATKAVTDLHKLQLQFGMADRDAPSGVSAAEVDKAAERPATLRAHYTHKGTVVRIQIYGDDLVKVGEAFDTVIQEQLTALAPNA